MTQRAWWTIGIALAAVGAALIVSAATRGASAASSKSGSVTLQSAPLSAKVSADGELEAVAKATLGASVPGVWDYNIVMLAPEGQQVKAGQPVGAFDTKSQRDTLLLRRSELDSAKKEYEKTVLEGQQQLEEMELQRAEALMRADKAKRKLDVPEEFVGRIELAKQRADWDVAKIETELNERRLETARANFDAKKAAAKNRIARLETTIKQLTERIDGMTLKAPRDGFVVYLTTWRGEKPKVGEEAWFGMALLEVADLSQMRINARVPESDAGHVRVGQVAEVRLKANPDKLFSGKVVQLGRIFHTKSDESPSVVFDAVIELEKPDSSWMRPGMAADITILADTAESVIAVPEEAIQYDSEGAHVDRLSPQAGRVGIKVGRRADGRVEVVEGLSAGDTVRVPGGKS